MMAQLGLKRTASESCRSTFRFSSSFPLASLGRVLISVQDRWTQTQWLRNRSRAHSNFSVMSELADDGSMAKNEKMSSSTGDNKKEVLLRELQKSIHFVKTIGPSHVPNLDKSVCVLALPAWFVKKHGDKFQQTVLLRSGLSTKPWRVQLTIYSRPSRAPEVKFGSGWREFSAIHGLIEGDDLLFSLSELSVFDVYIFRKIGNPVKPSFPQAPRKRSHDFEVSEHEIQKSGGYRVRHLNTRRTDGSKDDSSELFAKKKTAREGTVFAFHGRSTAGRLTSSNFDLHYLESRNLRDPPTFLCDSHEEQQPPVEEESEELVKPCTGDGRVKHFGARTSNGDEDEDMEFKKTKKMPPSFLKRLTASNFFSCKRPPRLEIPKDFVRTYGSGLQPPIVKLQGIREGYPVRIVVCACEQDAEKSSRLYLTDGWREFGDENGLKIGQELSFTLTADSFLVVRVNS